MAKPKKPIPYTDAEVQAATGIDPEIIREEYCRCPDDLRDFRKKLAGARADMERAALTVEQVEAAVRRRIRKDNAGLKRTDPGYMTADDVDAAVKEDDARARAVEAEIEARQARDELDGICEAIRAKKDLLVSLGADLRDERAAGR